MNQPDDNPTPKMDYLHTIDAVVLRYSRKDKVIEVLLHKRPNEPYAEQWALPGIVLNGTQRDVSMVEGVKRLINSEKVGFDQAYIEQVGTVGDAFRDPRCWSSSTFYMAVVSDEVTLTDRQKFVTLESVLTRKTLMPFDHNILVEQVAERLVSKSLYSSLPLLFLGSEFIEPEATKIYSVILGREVKKSSVIPRLAKLAEENHIRKTGEKKSGEGIAKASALMENLRPGEIYYFDRSFAYV
jgi:ADP-ribose pyrophosphatase YjhB (NUDIX family)